MYKIEQSQKPSHMHIVIVEGLLTSSISRAGNPGAAIEEKEVVNHANLAQNETHRIIRILLPVASRPTGGGSYEFSSSMIRNPTSNSACRNSSGWILRSPRIGSKSRRSSGTIAHAVL